MSSLVNVNKWHVFDVLIFSRSAHLGDFDPELHEQSTEYITEFKFIPNQVSILKYLYFVYSMKQKNNKLCTDWVFFFSIFNHVDLFILFLFILDQRARERDTKETQSSDVSENSTQRKASFDFLTHSQEIYKLSCISEIFTLRIPKNWKLSVFLDFSKVKISFKLKFRPVSLVFFRLDDLKCQYAWRIIILLGDHTLKHIMTITCKVTAKN